MQKKIKVKESNNIRVFFDENGITIMEILESDFANFVKKIIKEKVKLN